MYMPFILTDSSFFNAATRISNDTEIAISLDGDDTYDDDGNIVVRTLKEQGADETRRAIENNIYNTNSRRITKDTFERLQMAPYKAKPIYTKNAETGKDELLSGIEFEIDDYKWIIQKMIVKN